MTPALQLPAVHQTCGSWSASFQRVLLWLLTCAALTLAVGCAQQAAQPPQVLASERTAWNGRLALQVEDQASQSFSAGFELQGSAANGQLRLFSPLGSVLAQVEWAPGWARLQSSGEVRESDSLEELLAQTLGTPIPVTALIAWLQGTQTTASGWQADLSALDNGRLVATRYAPEPRAVLRVAFER